MAKRFFNTPAASSVMVADPPRRGVHRMVVVHLARGYGHARPRGVSHVVIEDEDAAGAQRIAHQALDFRVVDALDLVGRIEVCHRGRRLDEGEAVAVERELGRPRASSIVTSCGSLMPFERGTPGGGSMR